MCIYYTIKQSVSLHGTALMYVFVFDLHLSLPESHPDRFYFSGNLFIRHNVTFGCIFIQQRAQLSGIRRIKHDLTTLSYSDCCRGLYLNINSYRALTYSLRRPPADGSSTP